MDAKTVLTESIEELQALNEQLIAPYKNNDNIDFITTLHAANLLALKQISSIQNLNWSR